MKTLIALFACMMLSSCANWNTMSYEERDMRLKNAAEAFSNAAYNMRLYELSRH